MGPAADLAFMRRARDLARLGAGRTWTNPMVGAVVARDGREIGSGFHRRCGEAHAETLVLESVAEGARGATLYVNLEPCAHQGRTPPCVEAIVAAGISRVVIPALDPDPRVRGRGVAWLRARGVRVDVGCDAPAAVLDNQGYYHDRLGFATTVTLKMATSRDGMVARAQGLRDPVTGAAARLDVHRLRAVHDAVVVGVETARIDRPRLDCRLLAGGVDREPVPVVLDTHLRISADNAWASAGRPYVVVTGERPEAARVRAVEAAGGRVLRCNTDAAGIRVEHAIDRLAEIGLARILVEGGPRVFRSFLAAGAWDAAWLYRAEGEFGPGGVPLFDADGRAQPDLLGLPVDEVPVAPDHRSRHVRDGSWEPMMARLAVEAGAWEGIPADVHRDR